MAKYEPIESRLARRLTPDGDCLVWTGAVGSSGYGVIGLSRSARTDYAHRVAYRLAKGPIPGGRQVDHLCRNKLCCNPDHLEAVTQAENLRRELHVRWGGRTECPHGHSFAEFQRTTPGGRKYCTACHSAKRKTRVTGNTDHKEAT